MRILAFDAGCALPSAAAFERGGLVAAAELPPETGPAEGLIDLLAGLLASVGWSCSSLDALAVATGPGGFMGLRVGVAAGRGLALATGLSVFPVSYFTAIGAAARAAGVAGRLSVLKDVRRSQIMLQHLDADDAGVTGPVLLHPPAAANSVRAWGGRIVGDGGPHLEDLAAHVAPLPAAPFAAAVGQAALAELARGVPARPPAALRPFYPRPPDARPSLVSNDTAAPGRVV